MNRSFLNLLPFFSMILFWSCTTKSETKDKEVNSADNPIEIKTNNQWAFDKVSGTVLQFKNGKGLNTRLFNLKYIGQINNGDKAPFFIYSGKTCDNCSSKHTKIYVHSPSDTSETGKGVSRYRHPATSHYSNGAVWIKRRAFYGQVLKDTKGLMVYEENHGRSITKSIFLVNVNTGVKKHFMVREAGQLKETLQLLEEGKCKEIEE